METTGKMPDMQSAVPGGQMKASAANVGPGFRGIPNRKDFGDLSKLNAGELIDLIIQKHDARRAGLHRDLRIGDKDRGLYSWAMRAEDLPPPGKKVLGNQTPVHAHAYGAFQGTLGPGYGQGTVRTQRKGRILVTHASPTQIEFTTADTGTPERYVLFKPGGKFGERQWLLMNNTPTKPPDIEKPHFKAIAAEEVEPFIEQMQQGSTYQAKVDGAHSLIKLMKGGVEVTSYRTSRKTGGPITHTERVFGGRPKVDYPKALEGSVLRGEVYGADEKGKAIPVQETGGLLNSGIERSLQTQKARGQQLHGAIFDVARFGKKDIDMATVPYAERRDMVEQLLPYIPKNNNQFYMLPQETTPEGGKKLWHQITSGKHDVTHEGLVAYPPVGMPVKAKPFTEHDVHLTGVFPGEGKYRGRGIGGFNYALKPGGDPVGKVGTGLSDELRMHAFKHPDEYTGRVARISAQDQHTSGAFRVPSFLALHQDY